MSVSNPENLTIIPGIPMPRCHVYLPVCDPSGRLLSYLNVQVVETGTDTPINDVLYAAPEPSSQVLPNPISFMPGVIDIWSSRPYRADLKVTGPNGFSQTLTVDFLPRPEWVVRGDWPSQGQRPSVGDVLRDDGWGPFVSVGPHDHDGTQPGSTYLDPNNPNAADTTPNQTWVGAGSASTATDSTGGTALGDGAQAVNVDTVAIGQAAIAAGTHATVLGQGSDAASDYETILGSGLTGGAAGTVLLSAEDESGAPSGVGPTALSLRSLFSTSTATRLGLGPSPTVPSGTTYPFSLRGDVAIPGGVRMQSDAHLGTLASVLSMLGGSGAPQAPTYPASSIPALDSLVQALTAYGLFPHIEQPSTANAAVSFLKVSQDPPQGWFVSFNGNVASPYTGPCSGVVQNFHPVASQPVPYVAIDAACNTSAWNASGFTGTWQNLDNYANYQVNVYSVLDTEYLQGTFPLNANGTWTSGATVVHTGTKVARIVRTSDSTVVATSGGRPAIIPGYVARVFNVSDIPYQSGGDLTIYDDGSWSGTISANPAGTTMIARVYRTSDNTIVASTEWSKQTLPRSFIIEKDDPAYSVSLAQRCAVYDAALTAIAFLDYGEVTRAERILDTMVALQNPTGSWYFNYDAYTYAYTDPYVRTGAVAWVVMAAIHHRRVTGSTKYQAMATAGADYLIAQQAPSSAGALAGLVRQGEGHYDASYNFVPGQMNGAGTEHNLDAWFVFRDLFAQTGLTRFDDARKTVGDAMLAQFWNETDGRLNQGYQDPAVALDCDTWGGTFLLAYGDRDKAQRSLSHAEVLRVNGATVTTSSDPNHWNMHYSNPGPITGYKPYGDGYTNPPTLVWAEGTWGAVLLRKRLGVDYSDLLNGLLQMAATTGTNGSWIQVTYTQAPWPYEFQTWPCIASAAWAAMVLKGAPGVFRLRP